MFIASILPLAFSKELEKPCAGQPTIPEVLELVLKECRKESLVYKMAALRCAGDVLHSSQEDRFSDIAEILFPLIKKVQSLIYLLVCYYSATLEDNTAFYLCSIYFPDSQQSCPESGGASPRSLEDDDRDVKEKELQTEALLCAFETLGKAWPRNPQTQGKLQLVLRNDTLDQDADITRSLDQRN